MNNYVTNLTQGIELARKVSEWLASMESTKYTYPVRVDIGKQTFFGARYIQTLTPPAGSRNPEPYERDSIYLIGRLANTRDCGRFGYQPRRKYAYQFGDALYGVGFGITQESITDQNKHFHPFGVWFDLSPYSSDILTHDNGDPYPRKGIRITAL